MEMPDPRLLDPAHDPPRTDPSDLLACWGYMPDWIARADARAEALAAEILRLEIAREVAVHWRDQAIRTWGDSPMPGRVAAHPLALVLDALDGQTDPAQLGVDPGSPAEDSIRDLIDGDA